MKNSIYTMLDELTDQYVPDKLDDIMAEIAKQPEQKFSTSKDTVVLSNNKLKYTIAAACLCVIIASSAIVIPSLQNNNVNLPATLGNTDSNSTVVADEKDIIYWNNISLETGSDRLAGHFKEVTKDEWLSYYHVELPDNNNATYYLVYDISKEDGSATNNIMCGYIDFHLLNASDLTMYINEAPLGLSNNILIHDFTGSQLKESRIKNRKVYLGTADSKRCAAFNDGHYSFYVRMSNIEAEQSIELLKGILN